MIVSLLSGCAPAPFDLAPIVLREPADCPPLGPTAVVDAPPTDVRVQVWVGVGADEEALSASARTAAGWWLAHGIHLVSVGPARTLAGTPVLGGDSRTVAGATPRALYGPLADRVGAVARPPAHTVHLVGLRRIAAERSPAAAVFADIAGLTVSAPAMRALDLAPDPAPPASAAIREALGDAPFDPVVFVATDTLAEIGAVRARWVIAHELGHAFGLLHTDGADADLMAPDGTRCAPTSVASGWVVP